MSHDNVGRFLEAAEAFNRLAEGRATDGESLGRWLAFFDSEVLFEPRQADLEGRYFGHEGMTRWLLESARRHGHGRVDYDDFRDLGDRVLATGTVSVGGKSSGIELATPLAVVARFEAGLMTHLKDYGDRDEALRALGLAE